VTLSGKLRQPGRHQVTITQTRTVTITINVGPGNKVLDTDIGGWLFGR